MPSPDRSATPPLASSWWQHRFVPLLAILAVALVLRLAFVVGYVGGYPQDDGIYITSARQIQLGNHNYERYRDIDSDYRANPAETFPFRIGYIYPLALSLHLFGEGDLQGALPALIMSLLSIVVVALLGERMFSRRAGLFAAALLAVLPSDVLHATRILTDVPLGALFGLAVLAFVEGTRKSATRWFVLSGVALGLAYLVKLTAIPLAGLLLLPVVFFAYQQRRFRFVLGFVLAFAGVIFLESAWYGVTVGQFGLRYTVVHSSILFKFATENISSVTVIPGFRYQITESEFRYFAVLLGLAKAGPIKLSGFGGTFWFVIVGAVTAVALRQRLAARLVAGLVFLVYLYLELGPVNIIFEDGVLTYRGLYRQIRFLTVLVPIAIPFAGFALSLVYDRSRRAGLALFLVLAGLGVPSLLHDHREYRMSLRDMRLTADFLEWTQKPVYTDRFAEGEIRFFLGRRNPDLSIRRLYDVEEMSEVHDAYVVLGGSRSSQLMTDAVLESFPDWAREFTEDPDRAPPSWKPELVVRGPISGSRKHDLVVFRVPQVATTGR